MFMYKKHIVGGLLTATLATLLGGCATPDSTAPAAPARGPNLGETPSAAILAAMDTSIPPNGTGLPAGSGDVAQGAKVYTAKCESCHGPKGVGKPADALVGGIGSLASGKPMRTVGSYWPYATTFFDYVRRAMPTNAPQTLSNDEVYAVTAYVLNLNGIVPESAVMNAQTLPQVKMPNRDGFIDYSKK